MKIDDQIDSLIKPPRLRFPGKSEEEMSKLLRPTGAAERDRLVAARIELARERVA